MGGRVVAASVLSVLGLGAEALAAVVSSTGSAVIVGPPPSVALDAYEHDTEARAFNEVQDFTLFAGVAVDVTAVGFVSAPGDVTPGFIPAGVRVRSHLLHTDPVGGGLASYSGSITFDAQVIGIILSKQLLMLSDAQLGHPLTTYADHDARGLELGGADSIRLLPGRLTVEFSFNTSTATDGIRVITVVPAPASLGLLGLGALGVTRRSRRTRI